MADEETIAKAHRPKQSGPKAVRKKKKDEVKEDNTDSRRNAKAFTFRSMIKAAKQFRRSKDIEAKKHHVPVVDRTPLEPPPVIVAVVGPPKVGKTTLIKSLLKNFTRKKLSNIEGPVTLVSGKKRRLTFIECGNDINSMIDIAKVADLVLLLIDASFGFEMEVFEFLNVCQVHGFPKIMGVLTHLDMLKYNKSLKKIKKRLKDRFWTEVYQGAKLFYLSGLIYGSYPKIEIHNLGRFISVMKFRPLTWRASHPYILADRMEDLTDPESVRQNPKCDRRVSLYGYVRGAHLKYNSKVHLLGCGDFMLDDVSLLKDPCPLPDKEKKRSLDEREKMVYAPMSGVGGIVYDKDAVYIDLGGSHPARNQSEFKTEEEPNDNRPGNELVSSLKDTKHTLDSKMASSQMTLFKDGTSVSMQEIEETNGNPSQQLVQSEDGRIRRRAVFEDDKDENESDDDANDQDEEESEPEEDEQVEEEDEEEWQEQKENESDDDDDGDQDEEESEPEEDEEQQWQDQKENDSDDDDDGDQDEEESEPEEDEEQQWQDQKENDSDDDDDDNDDDEEEEDASGSDSDDNSLQIFQKKTNKGLKRKFMDEEEYDAEEDEEGQNDMNANQEQKSKGKELRNGDESTDVKNKKQKKKRKGKVKEELDDSEGSETELKNAPEKMDTMDVDDGEISFKKSTGKTTGQEGKSVESDSESSQDSTDDDSDDANDYDTDESNKDEDVIEHEDDDDVGYSSDSDQEIQNASSDNEVDFPTDIERGQLKWKENLFQKASESFYKHQQTTPNLRKLVYGSVIKETAKEEDAESNDEEKVGGFFKVKSRHQKTDDIMHQRDCSLEVSVSGMDWNQEEVCESIKDCFVTGKWNDNDDAEQLLNQDDELSDDEIFGDFEDLETGETHKASDGKITDEDEEENSDDNQEKESRMEKKKKLKAAFNAQYDEGDEVSFFEELKTQMSEQSQMNQREFEDMDDETRVQYEGFRPGMYVRVELKSMPCEFVTNFDAKYPIILGGVLPNEDSLGYIQIRVKRHRWFKRILKTRDPLILSIGWRRFQSMVMYSMQDHNGRHRLLKYTPEHLHCTGTMYGPIAPPTTGVLAVQSVAEATADFRIAATGTVLALDKTVELVKKLKLTGTPYKVFKNTAFIKGMFNSALEVAKFEGASIRSVSGIRGQIKRALKSPQGAFRATFEDKLLISDIVFVRTWYQVRIPKFYNPVTSLLLSNETKASWKGMKTVGQLRKEQGLKPVIKQDSLYKPIERHTRHFNPLVIPKKLQKELPFKSKPKNEKKRRKKTLEAKRAVVMEPAEKKVYTLMQQLQTVNKEKIRKQKEKKKATRKLQRAEMAKLESKRQLKRKEEKKKVYKMMAQAEKKKKRS